MSVLREQLGPHLGSSPLDLLAIVRHNLIGHVHVGRSSQPSEAMALESLDALLRGQTSQIVFLDLMAQYGASGVSGVVPKFLTPATQALFRKGTVTTERHFVKAGSEDQPFIAINEHLCMQVARHRSAGGRHYRLRRWPGTGR